MANLVFSLCAALASSLVVILAAIKGVWPVAAVFALLVLGFLIRATEGRR